MKNKKINCPCKRLKCERHGDCGACREYHGKVEKRFYPACERKNKKTDK